jgi:hypothetical protein
MSPGPSKAPSGHIVKKERKVLATAAETGALRADGKKGAGA